MFRDRVAFALLVSGSVLASMMPAQLPPLPSTQTLGGGCGAGASPALQLQPLLLGTSSEVVLTGALPGATAYLFAGLPRTSPLIVAPSCEVWIDPTAIRLLSALPVGSGGSVAATLPLLADPAWVGVDVALQAAVSPTAGPLGLDLSDAVLATIGDRRGPLAGLPSSAGAHIAQIQGLAPGAWLDLGVPAPDPVHGLATGRAFTPRMPWSSALGGAFFTGEGQHGFVNPNTGRYVDDVWFYDLYAHRWIVVKPGSHVATLSLSLNQDGFEVDAQGELVPVAQLGHGYEFVTFDETSRRFYMQPVPNTFWVPHMPQRLNWLPSSGFPLSQYRSPWVFDTVSGTWDRRPPGAAAPTFNTSSRGIAAQWVGSENKVWVFDESAANQSRIWWFDTMAMEWSETATATPGPGIGGNGVTCQDVAGGAIWYYGVETASGVARLWRYDVATRAWALASSSGVPPASSIYTTGFAALTYDAARDVVLLRMAQGGTTPPVFHPFDPATGAWEAPFSPPPSMASFFAWTSVNATYVPELDVHLFHVSASGAQTGRMLVYRHGP
ncbi:MAG: hypothetical protein CMJ83_03175 [Planctomycetes bacterium]|nr:hypothetical protein [Planctomycetota bacterium]